MIGLNGGEMPGKSSKGAMRLLDLRGQTWWFKKAIPADCRKAFKGRGTYLVNLQTSDVRLAKERRDELDAEFTDYCRQVRQGVETGEMSARGEGLRYRDTLRTIAKHGDHSEPGWSSPYDLTLEAAESAAERYRGKERREFEAGLEGKVDVGQHLEAYLAETDLAPKTMNERRGLVNRFVEWCDGEGFKLRDVNRRAAGQYTSAIIQPMHPRTAKKHLTALRGYWDYLRRRGHVDFSEARDNPWNDQIQPRTGRRGGARQGEPERYLEDEEINALLHGQPEDGTASPFDDVTRKVTLIGLLSGMRQSEIITLQVGDVVDDAGGGYGRVFDLKASKTEAGVRKVPVHPGLYELVTELMTGEDGKRRPDDAWLFAEYADMANPGDTFGKRFKRFREARGVDDRREGQRRSLVNFHSTRRWLVTKAEQADIPDSTIASVVGHSQGRDNITLGVYSGGPSGAQRRACIEVVKLPAHTCDS